MLEFTAFLVAAVENLAVSTAARAKFISPVTSSAAPVRKKQVLNQETNLHNLWKRYLR